MKKTLTTICMSVLVVAATFAQASKVMTASSYLSDYKIEGQNSEYLIKAKEAIDAAAVHETTSQQGKTWFLKGQILQAMGKDTTIEKTTKDEFYGPAYDAYKKALSIEDKKFREDDDVVKYMTALSADVFNYGVDAYQAGSFMVAYDMFELMTRVNGTLKENGGQGAVATPTVIGNMAMAADEAGDDAKVIAAYEQLIEMDPQPNYYRIIAQKQALAGDKDAAKATLVKGAEAFPDDADILIDQLNYYIQEGKLPEAIDIIDKAIALQPENDMLHFVKGDAYEKGGDPEKAMEEYEKAIAKNPKNTKALYNIGAMYFNKANVYVAEMNELSYKEEKKFNELNEKRMDLYRQAKPYFEKVLEIEPEDDGAQRALTKINSSLK